MDEIKWTTVFAVYATVVIVMIGFLVSIVCEFRGATELAVISMAVTANLLFLFVLAVDA